MASLERFMSGFLAQWRLLLMPMLATGVGILLGLAIRGRRSANAARGGPRQASTLPSDDDTHASLSNQIHDGRGDENTTAIVVTIERFLQGRRDGRTRLGHATIVNIGDEALATYKVVLFDAYGEEFANARINGSGDPVPTVHDLVARGLASALSGEEEPPPRPVHGSD